MPRHGIKPQLCLVCNRAWELEKRFVNRKNKQTSYLETIYHVSLPKLGLKKKICKPCKENY